jgi:hypothetical protein
MSDKAYKPSIKRDSRSKDSNEGTWRPRDSGSLRDFFIQKHEPEFNIAYDRSWQDDRREQEK